MDARASELTRQVNADPTNVEAATQLYRTLQSIDRRADLIPLKSPSLWDRAPECAQDRAISAIAGLLGPIADYQETRLFRAGAIEHRIATFRHVDSHVTFRLIPGLLGDDSNAISIIPPSARWVFRPCLMSAAPLSQEEWYNLDSSYHRPEPFLPATGIPHSAVVDTLSRSLGLTLPQRDEWIYACRAGCDPSWPYYWGDRMDPPQCWHGEGPDASPVDTETHLKREDWNAFGLVDMLGNVEEMTADEFTTLGGSVRSSAAECQIERRRPPRPEIDVTGIRLKLEIPQLPGKSGRVPSRTATAVRRLTINYTNKKAES